MEDAHWNFSKFIQFYQGLGLQNFGLSNTTSGYIRILAGVIELWLSLYQSLTVYSTQMFVFFTIIFFRSIVASCIAEIENTKTSGESVSLKVSLEALAIPCNSDHLKNVFLTGFGNIRKHETAY